MKNIFNNIKAYFVNINRYKAATTQESTFVILDTETTGLNVNEGHRIVSIAATKIKNLKITNEMLDELVNPERQISERSIEIHHITQEQVQNKPVLKELDDKIYNFLEKTVLVGHNLNFDIKFIDDDTNSIQYATTLSPNQWSKTSIRYYKNWRVIVQKGDDILINHKINYPKSK